MKKIITSILFLCQTNLWAHSTFVNNNFFNQGGSVNNGSGEVEKKIQLLYSGSSQSQQSIGYLIKQCLKDKNCANSENEKKFWNELLTSIVLEKASHKYIYFSEDHFKATEDQNLFFKTQTQVGAAIFFNPSKLYFKNSSDVLIAISDQKVIQLLTLALLSHLNHIDEDYRLYMALNLSLLVKDKLVRFQ